jgi:hypothetical protein
MTDSLNQFVLVKAHKSRGGAHSSPDDYDVRDSHSKVVERIMHHPQAPQDQPWFWTITAREIPGAKAELPLVGLMSGLALATIRALTGGPFPAQPRWNDG